MLGRMILPLVVLRPRGIDGAVDVRALRVYETPSPPLPRYFPVSKFDKGRIYSGYF